MTSGSLLPAPSRYPEPWVLEAVVSRLRNHLEMIETRDFDYFASLRYRDEASLAISDLERLLAWFAGLQKIARLT